MFHAIAATCSTITLATTLYATNSRACIADNLNVLLYCVLTHILERIAVHARIVIIIIIVLLLKLLMNNLQGYLVRICMVMLNTLVFGTRSDSTPRCNQRRLIFLMINNIHALTILGWGTLRLSRWLLPHLLYGGNEFHIIYGFGWFFVTVWSFNLSFFENNKWWFWYFWWLISIFTIWFRTTSLTYFICSIRRLCSSLLIFIEAVIQIGALAHDNLTDLLFVAAAIQIRWTMRTSRQSDLLVVLAAFFPKEIVDSDNLRRVVLCFHAHLIQIHEILLRFL